MDHSRPSEARLGPFAALLDLEFVEADLYRGHGLLPADVTLWRGHIAAQSLVAAARTVDPRSDPHSIQGYFLDRFTETQPAVYRVRRDSDQGSVATRHVVALQHGNIVFTMSASFDAPEPNLDPTPRGAAWTRNGTRFAAPCSEPWPFGLQVRFAPPNAGEKDCLEKTWIRAAGERPDDVGRHNAIVAYVADVCTGRAALGDGGAGRLVDKAMWFHRRHRVDEWFSVDLSREAVVGRRSWYLGRVHDQDERLVATFAHHVWVG